MRVKFVEIRPFANKAVILSGSKNSGIENSLACEQAPVGDSRVQSRANRINREWSGEEGVCRGAFRHSIDAAVP